MNWRRSCPSEIARVGIVRNKVMALAIRTIPTLSGEDAINFEEKANKVEGNPHTIDCSKDIEIVHQYLNNESPSK